MEEDKNNEENKFSSQYLEALQNCVAEITKDPKSLEDMLSNFMKVQESIFSSAEENSDKILSAPGSQDLQSSERMISVLEAIREDVKRLGKRMSRLERALGYSKPKPSSSNAE